MGTVLGRRGDTFLLGQGLPEAGGGLDLSCQHHQSPSCLERCAVKVRKPFLQECVQGLISDVCLGTTISSDAAWLTQSRTNQTTSEDPYEPAASLGVLGPRNSTRCPPGAVSSRPTSDIQAGVGCL